MTQEITVEKGLGRQIYFEGLKTTPFFQYGNQMLFAFEDVPFFPRANVEDKAAANQYIKECGNAGIIPFSQIELHYSGYFSQESFTVKSVDMVPPHFQYNSSIVEAALKGGRAHTLLVDIQSHAGSYQPVIDSFVDKGLPLLTTTDYLLQSSSAHLLTDGSGSQYDYPDHQVYFNFGVEGDQANIGLKIGNRCRTEWKVTKITEWFNQLSQNPQRELRLFVNA